MLTGPVPQCLDPPVGNGRGRSPVSSRDIRRRLAREEPTELPSWSTMVHRLLVVSWSIRATNPVIASSGKRPTGAPRPPHGMPHALRRNGWRCRWTAYPHRHRWSTFSLTGRRSPSRGRGRRLSGLRADTLRSHTPGECSRPSDSRRILRAVSLRRPAQTLRPRVDTRGHNSASCSRPLADRSR